MSKKTDKKTLDSENVYKDFEIDTDEPVYTTGIVSRLLKIPVWTLKKFDREKIVTPKRREGNDRLYSKRDLSLLYYYWGLMKKKKVRFAGLKVIKQMKEEDMDKT